MESLAICTFKYQYIKYTGYTMYTNWGGPDITHNFLIPLACVVCQKQQRYQLLSSSSLNFLNPFNDYLRVLSISNQQHQQLLSSFPASSNPCARPERRYCSNSIRISDIGLKFSGVMYSSMKWHKIRIKWSCHFNSVRISCIGLKFPGMMHSAMKLIAI